MTVVNFNHLRLWDMRSNLIFKVSRCMALQLEDKKHILIQAGINMKGQEKNKKFMKGMLIEVIGCPYYLGINFKNQLIALLYFPHINLFDF